MPLFFLVLPTSGAYALVGADVAIYVDRSAPLGQRGAWEDGITAIESMLSWMGLTYEEITFTHLNSASQDWLGLYKVLVVPGGWAQWYNYWIKKSGKQRIRDFVNRGGGYFGICAGAYFACDVTISEGMTYDDNAGLNAYGELTGYDLDLFPGSGTGPLNEIADWDTEGYNMANFLFQVEHEALSDYKQIPFSEAILYYGGPYFTADVGSTTSTVATYEHAVYSGKPAIVSFDYGQGRVVLWGPHPEIEEDSARDGVTIDREATMNDQGSDWTLALHMMDWLMKVASPSSVGWAETTANNLLPGLLLYGDKKSEGMAGLALGTTPSKNHALCHFHSSSRWYTGVSAANPSDDLSAHLSFQAYGDSGQPGATYTTTLGPHGKMSSLVSTILGSPSGTGWIALTSDVEVEAFELYGDKISGGLAGLPSSATGTSLVLPHFHCSSRWWTGISVVNPNATAVSVTLTAYGNDGSLKGETTQSIPSKGKLSGMADSLLGVSGQTGWILLTATGGSVAGLVVYGDSQSSPNEIAALPAMTTASKLHFSGFSSDTSWWTGIAMVNPDKTLQADVTLTAYAPDGTVIDSNSQSVPALSRVVGVVNSLFELSTHTEGWVEASSSRGVVGLQLIHGDDAARQAWGLAGIGSQPPGVATFLTHYDVTPRWWTWFFLANPNNSLSAQSKTTFYTPQGTWNGAGLMSLPPKGQAMIDMTRFLGMP